MRISFCFVAFVLVGAHTAAQGQSCINPHDPRLVTIGGRLDQSLRDSALLGRCRSSLIRTPSALSAGRQSSRRWSGVAPTIVTVWNSTIPVTGNTGSMWAGRGLNSSITGGVRWDARNITVILAPEVAWSRNRGFPVLRGADSTRSTFASPWYSGPISADLPVRFGSEPFALVTPGQTTVEVHGERFAGGFSAENQWWGPGLRNAIVMSNNAAGIPQLYARTRRPLRTPIGELEGRILLGQLTGSRFFDAGSSRSLSAAVLTLRVPFDTGLSVGVARAVYGPINGVLALPKHWADVLGRWNQTSRFSQSNRPLSQILSLFYHWALPSAGFETYGEWARLAPPASLADWVVQPQRGQGYTLGVQSLRIDSVGSGFRIQAEATMLEQTPSNPGELIPIFYTSNRAPGGYTQRGQIIGASIGPGGSSQFVAADLVRPSWTAGLQVGRIQWNHEAYYRQPIGVSYKHHDVSIFAGLRGAIDLAKASISGELTATERLNFLFQGTEPSAFEDFFDVGNLTLKLSIAPGPRGITRQGGRR